MNKTDKEIAEIYRVFKKNDFLIPLNDEWPTEYECSINVPSFQMGEFSMPRWCGMTIKDIVRVMYVLYRDKNFSDLHALSAMLGMAASEPEDFRCDERMTTDFIFQLMSVIFILLNKRDEEVFTSYDIQRMFEFLCAHWEREHFCIVQMLDECEEDEEEELDNCIDYTFDTILCFEEAISAMSVYKWKALIDED